MGNYEELVRDLRAYAERKCPLDDYAKICGNFDARSAADAIEELQRKKEHCERASEHWCNVAQKFRELIPRWISVKERLPEKPKNYPDCEIRQCYFLVALDSTAVISCGYDFDKKRWHHGYVVTHWMPLPQPPQGEIK